MKGSADAVLAWLRTRPLAIKAAVAACAITSGYAWLAFFSNAIHAGMFGLPNFHGLGTDWMIYHAVASNYLTGHPAVANDGFRLTTYVNQHYAHWLQGDLSYRAWVYPPSYLLVIIPFGVFGFALSYALFQIATAAGLVAATRTATGGEKFATWAVPLAILLSPAAAMNVLCGQNAFLMAACVVGGFALLKERPAVAGAILGMASLKPQLALLVPVALIAGGEWKALATAALSAILLVILSAVLFGADAWIAWFHNIYGDLVTDNTWWIPAARLWGISVWACAKLLGLPGPFASLLQDVAMAFAAIAVFLTFRRSTSLQTRLVVLLAGTILAAPYTTLYDAVFLSIAAAFWLTERARYNEPAAWLITFFLWAIPDLSPPRVVPPGRLGPLFIVAFLLFVLARINREPAIAGRGQTVTEPNAP
jgi:alpha-1,2-mannosyltransferase